MKEVVAERTTRCQNGTTRACLAVITFLYLATVFNVVRPAARHAALMPARLPPALQAGVPAFNPPPPCSLACPDCATFGILGARGKPPAHLHRADGRGKHMLPAVRIL